MLLSRKTVVLLFVGLALAIGLGIFIGGLAIEARAKAQIQSAIKANEEEAKKLEAKRNEKPKWWLSEEFGEYGSNNYWAGYGAVAISYGRFEPKGFNVTIKNQSDDVMKEFIMEFILSAKGIRVGKAYLESPQILPGQTVSEFVETSDTFDLAVAGKVGFSQR